MEKTNLYNLPKDMLIKLITTIQDCKQLSNMELEKSVLANIAEMDERKTANLKSFFNSKDVENVYCLLIKNIKVIKLKQSQPEIVIEFDENVIITCRNIGLLSIWLNNRSFFDILGEITIWKCDDNTKEKYFLHYEFIKNIIQPSLHIITSYLSHLIMIDVNLNNL